MSLMVLIGPTSRSALPRRRASSPARDRRVLALRGSAVVQLRAGFEEDRWSASPRTAPTSPCFACRSARSAAGPEPGGPEKAVANWDEDAVTMAVAAAIDCLRGIDRATVDGVLFASTSYAFKEKQGAGDHRQGARPAPRRDHRRRRRLAARRHQRAARRGRRRQGGLRQARAGRRRRDAHGRAALGARGEPRRRGGGVPGRRRRRRRRPHAAHAVTDEIIDVWRAEGDPFVHTWEDRFVVDHGYRTSVREAVQRAAREDRPRAKDFDEARALRPGRAQPRRAGARARLRPGTQAAGPALRQARQRRRRVHAAAPGRSARGGQGRASACCVVGYGDGADALLARDDAVVERLEGRRGVALAPGAPRPSCRATTCICASASSSPPSTTAAPAPASPPPSTSATATTT